MQPEIPYQLETVAEAVTQRVKNGKNFSIVAVAEGAMSTDEAHIVRGLEKLIADAEATEDKKARQQAKQELRELEGSRCRKKETRANRPSMGE